MKKIRKYLYIFGLFFLIFPPHILIYGYTVKTVYLFVFVPGLIGGYNFFTKQKGSIVEKATLAFMLIALAYFSIFSGIYLFRDVSVVNQILKGFIILFACSFYVNIYNKIYGDHFVTRLFVDLNKIGIIHSSIVIATFLSPDFRDFLYSFIGLTEKSTRYLYGEVLHVRYQGIVVSGFSMLSTTHALLLVIGVWGFYMDKEKHRLSEIILFSLGQIMIFISIVLIGRTGFVVIILFLGALLFYRIDYFKKCHHVSKKSIKLMFAFIVIAITIMLTVDLSEYKKNIDYAFETVIKYYESQELDSSTTEVLQKHFIFPDTTYEILFGTGNFGRSDNLPYIHSDVGYVLFIFGAGVFGMLVGYSFYFIGLFYSYKYRSLNPYLSAFIVVFLFVLIILNLKDYYYIGHIGYSQIYFIMICALGTCVGYRNNIKMKKRYF